MIMDGVGRIGIGGRYLFLLMHRLFHRILLFQFHQILPHPAVYLGYFFQLLTRNPTLFSRVGLHEASVHRQMVAPHQAYFHTLLYDLHKQFLEQLRFLKATVAVLGERRVMRNLLIET
jgi:hypothetical protein